MALTDDLARLLGFGEGPDNNAEVSFKIKPLGSVNAVNGAASDPAATGVGGETSAGVGGAGSLGATPGSGGGQALGPGNVPLGFGPGGQSVVPIPQQQRRTNPQLITHPLGAQTDDIYEAAVAQLQFDTQSRHAQLLQELGFIGEDGTFMPGTLETDASRQRAELERQREVSLEDVVNAAVRGGTVFSGRRATNTARAQQPFDAAIGELTTRLSRELAARYQGLGGLTQQFEIGRNMLLAEAAERIKAGLMGGAVGGEGGPGGPLGPGGVPGSTVHRVPSTVPGMNQTGGAGTGPNNTMPPGARQIYDPSQGYIVVDAQGRRIGHIDPVSGRFVNTGLSTGGSRTSVAM